MKDDLTNTNTKSQLHLGPSVASSQESSFQPWLRVTQFIQEIFPISVTLRLGCAFGWNGNDSVQSMRNTILNTNWKAVQSSQVHYFANCSLDQKVRRTKIKIVSYLKIWFTPIDFKECLQKLNLDIQYGHMGGNLLFYPSHPLNILNG